MAANDLYKQTILGQQTNQNRTAQQAAMQQAALQSAQTQQQLAGVWPALANANAANTLNESLAQKASTKTNSPNLGQFINGQITNPGLTNTSQNLTNSGTPKSLKDTAQGNVKDALDNSTAPKSFSEQYPNGYPGKPGEYQARESGLSYQSPENSLSYQSPEKMKSWSEMYPNGYRQSAAVTEAQNILNGILGSRPGAYEGKYDRQIAELYSQIMNRPQFQYDVNKDPLFQQYKNQYMVNGQRAMQDTMGQAAALAGGYGSSWGTTAGYQAYQQYLQALNDKIPELEQRAFDRYSYEGDQMRSNMSLTMDMDSRDYNRYRDSVADWQADRAFEYGRYRDAVSDWKDDRAFEYGQYRDSVSDWENERAFNYSQYRDQMADWQADRAFGYNQYRDQMADYQADRAFNYGQYRDAVSDWQSDRAFDYGQYRDSMSDYYNDRNYNWNVYDAEATREMNNYWNQKNYDLEVQKFLASLMDQKSGSGSGSGKSSGQSTGRSNTKKNSEAGHTLELPASSEKKTLRTDINDEYRTAPYNNGNPKTRQKRKQFGTA